MEAVLVEASGGALVLREVLFAVSISDPFQLDRGWIRRAMTWPWPSVRRCSDTSSSGVGNGSK